MRLYKDYFDINKANLPYETIDEANKELLTVLDMLLECYLDKKGGFPGPGAFSKGLMITENELKGYLDTPGFLREKDYPELLLQEEVKRALEHIETRKETSGFKIPFFELKESFCLSEYESLALLLALAYNIDAGYSRFFAFLQDDITFKEPTAGLLNALALQIMEVSDSDTFGFISSRGKMGLFLMDFHSDKMEGLLYKKFRLKERVLGFLLGFLLERKESVFLDLKNLAPTVKGLNEETAKDIKNHLKKEKLLVLTGSDSLYKELFLENGCVLNLKDIREIPDKERNDFFAGLGLTLYTKPQEKVFVKDLKSDWCKEEAVKNLFRLLETLKDTKVVVDYDSSESQNMDSNDFLSGFSKIDTGLPDVEERLVIWKHLLGDINLSKDIDLSAVADCYKLSATAIGDAIVSIKQISQKEDPVSRKSFYDVLMGLCSAKFSHLAGRIKTMYTWEDLEIAPDQRQILKTACNRYRLSSRVSKSWNLRSKNAYGNGVSLLLYGPPGTGKTMASQVISGELGLPLYRVDLSQITSKYIGETEKNLSLVFDEASKNNLILFFDEADALFSKRTEVGSSNDKYANAETAYLLQKIEEYEGFTILATNLYANFDPAFLRRITYTAKFELPDEDIRLNIWNSVLPEEVPRDPKLDLGFFARKFDLSGSNIKAIMNSAIYMAAAENAKLSNRHIVVAAKFEFAKLGRMVSPSDFEGYAGFFNTPR